MRKKSSITQYTSEELDTLREDGGSRSDWNRAAAMTADQIDAASASDPDEAGMVIDWSRAEITMPDTKAVLHMRIDKEVLDFFRTGGRGYQTKINAVLRAYVQAHSPK